MILVASRRTASCRLVATLLRQFDAAVLRSRSVRSAQAVLRRGGVSVVLCDRDLPGGGWGALFLCIATLPTTPLLIVTSPSADERLWAEVLNVGGYDVLAEPFDEFEVQRSVARAQEAFLAAPRARGHAV